MQTSFSSWHRNRKEGFYTPFVGHIIDKSVAPCGSSRQTCEFSETCPALSEMLLGDGEYLFIRLHRLPPPRRLVLHGSCGCVRRTPLQEAP